MIKINFPEADVDKVVGADKHRYNSRTKLLSL